jgi:hypothetical protein
MVKKKNQEKAKTEKERPRPRPLLRPRPQIEERAKEPVAESTLGPDNLEPIQPSGSKRKQQPTPVNGRQQTNSVARKPKKARR